MKLNHTSELGPKTGFIGLKEDQATATAFRAAAKSDGGASAVLRRFIRRYLRSKRSRRRVA